MKRPFCLALLGLSLLFSATAHAVIVERIVAVVGDRPILLSELKRRARPLLFQVYASNAAPAEVVAQESQVNHDVLERMINDRLVEQAADRAKRSVSAQEIERAVKQRAEALKVDVSTLLQEARRQGLTEQDYRDEIRRQLLEGKMIQSRLQGRINVTDEDARASYQKWVRELGNDKLIDIRLLPLRIPPGATEEQSKQIAALAEDLVTRARRGDNFCELVQQHSDDPSSKSLCGSRGLQPKSAFLPVLQRAVEGLKEGEVAQPIQFGNEAILIVQLAKADKIPTFEEVKVQMGERALNDVVERQRKLWLDELRRGLYIDSRM